MSNSVCTGTVFAAQCYTVDAIGQDLETAARTTPALQDAVRLLAELVRVGLVALLLTLFCLQRKWMERANKGPLRAACYCAVVLAFLLWKSYLRAAAVFLYDPVHGYTLSLPLQCGQPVHRICPVRGL